MTSEWVWIPQHCLPLKGPFVHVHEFSQSSRQSCDRDRAEAAQLSSQLPSIDRPREVKGRAQSHTASRGHQSWPRSWCACPPAPPPSFRNLGPAGASLWGAVGVNRTHLGPWLNHSTALSLSFQIRQVKGLDQKIAKIPSASDIL